MRALVLAEFGRLEIRQVPDPVPAEDEVLIKVDAVGICGSDLHGFTGETGRRQPDQIMGHEASGTVLSAPETAGLSVGQAVTFDPLLPCRNCAACQAGEEQGCPDRRLIGVNPEIQAAFAEQIAVPAENVVALPPELDVSHGALIEPLAVAFHAVRRSSVAPADRVLVVGGGPIGQSVVLALRAIGATDILLSEPNPQRRAVCADLGASVIDGLTGTAQDQLRAIGDRPVDLTIDAVGQSRTLGSALAVTKPGGTVTLVGMGSPQVELPAYDISTAERTLIGSFCYADADFRATVSWAGENAGELATLVTEQVPLEQAQAAFAALTGERPVAGKVLVRPND